MKNSGSVTRVFNPARGVLFLLLVSCSFALAAQTNDLCVNAIPLNISAACSVLVFSTENATREAATVAANPSCGNLSGGDVWFTLVVPTSGALRIETDNLAGATPHVMTFYSGTCGSFTEQLCIQLDRQRTIRRPDLAGQTLYLRMFNYAGTFPNGSSFELCVFEPPIPLNDNCAAAIEIPEGETCNLQTFTNKYATAESISVAPAPSCGQFAGGDVWFKTTVPASGTLRLEVEKSATIYTGVCGALQEKFCKQLNDAVIFQNAAWGGQEVYIRVYTYANEEGSNFDMCLFNPELPANDNCAAAIDIPVTTGCDPDRYSNKFATAEDGVAPPPSCGKFRGGDTWFKTTVPASGRMVIGVSKVGGGAEPSVALYAGVCQTMTEISCYQLGDQYLFENAAYGNQEVYLRLFSYDSEEGSTFDLCIYEPTCQNVTYDAGTVAICEGSGYAFGNDILTEPGSYAATLQTAGGCDSLVNLVLVVNPATHDTSISQNGITFTANAANATYQWLDCDKGLAPIAGEVGRSFTATEAGNYAVSVSYEGCADTSACVSLIVLDVVHSETGPAFRIYPNPFADRVTVELDAVYEHVDVELRDTRTQLIADEHFYGRKEVSLDVGNVGAGVYLLKISTRSQSEVRKLVKQ